MPADSPFRSAAATDTGMLREHNEDRYFIEQGFRMGAAVFNGLYENLYRERRLRPTRGVSGPHLRA